MASSRARLDFGGDEGGGKGGEGTLLGKEEARAMSVGTTSLTGSTICTR